MSPVRLSVLRDVLGSMKVCESALRSSFLTCCCAIRGVSSNAEQLREVFLSLDFQLEAVMMLAQIQQVLVGTVLFPVKLAPSSSYCFWDTFALTCPNSSSKTLFVFQTHPLGIVNMNQDVFNIPFGDLLTIPFQFSQQGKCLWGMAVPNNEHSPVSSVPAPNLLQPQAKQRHL